MVMAEGHPSGTATEPTRVKRSTTRQQRAVAEALARQDAFCTAQELHARMREAGVRIGLTTVYRALAGLAASGEVDSLRAPSGEVAYRRCVRDHHHHLICRDCGRTVEVEGPSVEAWAAEVAARAGYVDVTHTVEVFGSCSQCQRRRRHADDSSADTPY